MGSEHSANRSEPGMITLPIAPNARSWSCTQVAVGSPRPCARAGSELLRSANSRRESGSICPCRPSGTSSYPGSNRAAFGSCIWARHASDGAERAAAAPASPRVALTRRASPSRCSTPTCHHGNTRFSIENPAASRFWEWEPLKRRLRRARARRIAFPQCAFGTPFKKPTVLWTDCEALGHLERVCTCSGHSERLQGLVKPPGGKWVWKTSLASAYPPTLCRAYARAVHAAAPRAAHRADGEDALRSRWEQELAACVGQRVEQPLLAPRCPRRYAIAWAGAQR